LETFWPDSCSFVPCAVAGVSLLELNYRGMNLHDQLVRGFGLVAICSAVEILRQKRHGVGGERASFVGDYPSESQSEG